MLDLACFVFPLTEDPLLPLVLGACAILLGFWPYWYLQ